MYLKKLFLSSILLLASFSQIYSFETPKVNILSKDNPKVDVTAQIELIDNKEYVVFVNYTFPEGFHQSFQPEFFHFSVSTPDQVFLGEILYPKGSDFYGKTQLSAVLNNYDPLEVEELSIKATYQLCNEEGMCLFPQSTEIAISSSNVPEKKSNILFFLLLAFLGGILLNVMPCVLPVLSIKSLSLVNQSGENKKEILSSSILYSAGVIISLLVLAVVIIVLKASGEQVGWGFQFQSRNFVLILLTIIFVFALSLFDIFTISAPALNTKTSINKKNKAGTHFVSGIFAVLLATPCTAPFLGTAAGFAFSQSALVILAIFFMVGLGLSLPFIIIGFIPSAVSKLPKPGAWMNTFREIMGFLLLATCIWLIDVLSHQNSNSSAGRVLIYLIVTAFSVWFYGKLSSPGASRKKRLSALLASILTISLTAGFLFFGKTKTSNEQISNYEESNYSSWMDFSPDLVNSFAGGENPVFIAFSAKWCMTCRTNEASVIFSDEVLDFFKKNKVILIHGDYTNRNPEIDSLMQKFGRAGVPFYLWYPANKEKPILLPELLQRKTITSLKIE